MGSSFLAVDWYVNDTCGGFIENGLSLSNSAPLDTWFQKTVEAAVAPPGTGGLLVLAGVVSSDVEVPHALFVDEVFVPEPAAGLGAASALATLATFRMRWGRSVPTAGEGRPSATR